MYVTATTQHTHLKSRGAAGTSSAETTAAPAKKSTRRSFISFSPPGPQPRLLAKSGGPCPTRRRHATTRTTSEQTAAIRNAPGMVRIHAHTTLLATPHRTADNRRVAPTPTIAPVIVWVVDTGIPDADAKNSAPAAADSAAMPPTG